MSRLTTERTRGLKRVEYEALAGRGFFDDERLELLDGALVVKEPQGSYHCVAVLRVQRVLARAFGRRYHLRPPRRPCERIASARPLSMHAPASPITG